MNCCTCAPPSEAKKASGAVCRERCRVEHFAASTDLSIGIEEEYQLCDPHSGELMPLMTKLMGRVPKDLAERISYELLEGELEVNTSVCKTPQAAASELARHRARLVDEVARMGGMIVVSGAHPTAKPQDQTFVPTEHYAWVSQHAGFLARQNISFGLHVHVGLECAESAIYCVNALRRWGGALLALSANSPFYAGMVTNFKSARTYVFGMMPRTGFPPRFASYHEYEEYLRKMIASGTIKGARDLWWNIRAHPIYGTLEARICDVQRSLARTEALAAVIQALAAAYIDMFWEKTPEPACRDEFLDQNLWSAARYGLDGKMLDPRTGEIAGTRDVVGRMLDYVGGRMRRLGTHGCVATIEKILDDGAEADEQLAIYKEVGGDFSMLQRELAARSKP